MLVVSASILKHARLKWTVLSTELHLSDPRCWHVSVTQPLPFQANKDQLLNKVGDWTRPAVASKLFNALLETARLFCLNKHLNIRATLQSLCMYVNHAIFVLSCTTLCRYDYEKYYKQLPLKVKIS